MNLKQMAARGQAKAAPEIEAPNPARCLTLLIEGMALNMPEIDAPTYKLFRESLSSMARQVPDRLSETDILPVINSILRECETYRSGVDSALRDRQAGWRNLTARLLRELLGSMRIEAGASGVSSLTGRIAALRTAEDLREYQESLDDFLRPRAGEDADEETGSQLSAADRSTANTNAAGLRGGGAALEQVKVMMQRGNRGFLVLFQLGCLEMIHERFGTEAVEDCLMAVSAHLTHSLHSDDSIYHWSDSSLLAILQGRVSEQILTAELNRIVAHNRDLSIIVGGRTVMLRR